MFAFDSANVSGQLKYILGIKTGLRIGNPSGGETHLKVPIIPLPLAKLSEHLITINLKLILLIISLTMLCLCLYPKTFFTCDIHQKKIIKSNPCLKM